jgi:hypothetical protein
MKYMIGIEAAKARVMKMYWNRWANFFPISIYGPVYNSFSSFYVNFLVLGLYRPPILLSIPPLSFQMASWISTSSNTSGPFVVKISHISVTQSYGPTLMYQFWLRSKLSRKLIYVKVKITPSMIHDVKKM